MSAFIIDGVASQVVVDHQSEHSFYASCTEHAPSDVTVVASGPDTAGAFFSTPLTLKPSNSIGSPYVFGQDWLNLARINAAVSSNVGGEPSTERRPYFDAPVSPLSYILSNEEPNDEEPLSALPNADPFNDNASNAASRSNIFIDNMLSTEQLRFRGLRAVEDNLYRKKQTGIRLSVFDSAEDQLHKLATLHGILTNPQDSKSEVSMSITHHLLYGHCVNVSEMDQKESRPACNYVSGGFSSVRELSDAVVDSLIQYKDDMSKLPPRKLIDIVAAIDYPRLTSSAIDANRNGRRDAVQRLKAFRNTARLTEVKIRDTFSSQFEDMSRASAANVAVHHGITVHSKLKKEEIKELIIDHLLNGRCMKDTALFEENNEPSDLCNRAVNEFYNQTEIPHRPELFDIYTVSSSLKSMPLKSARRMARSLSIPYDLNDNKSKVVTSIKKWLRTAVKGKLTMPGLDSNIDVAEQKARVRRQWPQLVSAASKAKMISLFKKMTSSKQLESVTCASCSTMVLKHKSETVAIDRLNMECLKRPDLFEDVANLEDRWLDADVLPPPMPYDDGPLRDVLLDPKGVSETPGYQTSLTLCRTCSNSIKRDEVPPCALANRMYLGDVPPELQDLTVIEEAMIARCRAQCWVVQLKEDNQEIVMPTAQRGLKGHIIIYPQNPSAVAEILPPSIEDITSPLCVLFVGATQPSEQWLREKAKPLAVRGHKVRNALIWLKRNNRFYKDIIINEPVLQQLETNPIMPFHIETISPSVRAEEVTSRYDSTIRETVAKDDTEIAFENVVITDVSGGSTVNELRAAAFRHMKKQGKGYIQIGRESAAVNEFNNPAMLPMCYPTLFPYGLGGSDDAHRANPVSLKRHVKHLFSIRDQRFQTHYSFMFIVFNILQRREALLRTSLKTKRANFAAVANEFSALSAEAIHSVAERAARGDFSVQTAEERRVMKLMREVNAVTSYVPGSPASKVSMRNEIRSLIIDQGVPHFYITINPADVYNPLVRFLAGSEIDIDKCVPKDHQYHEQAMLVAKNPAAAAKFFNIYMKAFVHALLGFREGASQEGILGTVKAYYGTVEAQGRGTLHCHMMIWVEGGLHPDEVKSKLMQDDDGEFRQRLFAFLDDTISTELPSDPDSESATYHPCSVRGPLSVKPEDVQKDNHLLVVRCQYHTHSKTCYKYDSRQCRFELGDDRTLRPVTVFNSETGEIEQRCLHALVNNFNATILSALRCNMDIKYIASGASAKAVIFYITDYITKSQLQAHVAYAALELAYKQLQECNSSEDNVTAQAKKLLQKCVYALISHQEMSAQQVASYLMDLEDHFTSHQFVNVPWLSFESFVDEHDPSPECYPQKPTSAQEKDECSSNDNEELPNPYIDTISPPLEKLYDDEITLHSKTDGSLVPKVSIVEDYIHRGPLLADVSVWDYVSRIEKINRKHDHKKYRKGPTSDADILADLEFSESEHTDGHRHETIPSELNSILWDLHFHPNPLLTDNEYRRPRVDYSHSHSEQSTHCQKIRTRHARHVPVPIGPALPRRDRDELKEKHARLMLIFFKPWSSVKDLREAHTSWSDAYSSFVSSCDARICRIIENMQVLHECRDARDDHFAKRSKQARSDRVQTSQSQPNHLGEILTEELLREHLLQIQEYQSDNISNISAAASACLNAVSQSGYFSATHVERTHQEMNESSSFLGKDTCVAGPKDNSLELKWQAAYEQRKVKTKLAFMDNLYKQSDQSSSNAVVQVQSQRTESDMMNIDESPSVLQGYSNLQTLHPGNATMNSQIMIDFHSLSNEWQLNKEQALAFRLIVAKSVDPASEPLQLIIAGQGGTGKSRVIQAVANYFERTNQSRRLRLTSYTGIAAKNISGSTLHAALHLSSFSSGKTSSTCASDLVSMWQGVDFLFIDEFSMIGCSLLYEISRALSVAKENVASFGGINIIFAGDFAQLPPVGYKRLYSEILHAPSKGKRRQPSASEKDVIGKLLWLSIRDVVILKQVWRQKVDVDDSAEQVKAKNEFIDLLQRLREGRCSDDDYRLLCSRIVGNINPDWSLDKWRHTPMIVCQNEAKDVLNNAASVSFAERTGRELQWYYAVDRHDGTTLTDPDLLNHLRSLNSSVTNYRQGKLPLVIGMPVMVTTNFDVEGGIVNGCAGTLESVRYWVNSHGERHALSCVIRSDTFSGESLPNLQLHDAAAISDEKSIQFVHPASGKKCTIKRVQLPILPAFAMTAHKSQGLTLPSALIDLESCRGSESPYVMISRVRSLDDLLIMRPFQKDRISRWLSEDVRREFSRLAILELLTLIEHGESEDRDAARTKLASKGLLDLIEQQHTAFDIDIVNLTSLQTRQNDIARQVQKFDRGEQRQKKRMRRDDPASDTSKSRKRVRT